MSTWNSTETADCSASSQAESASAHQNRQEHCRRTGPRCLQQPVWTSPHSRKRRRLGRRPSPRTRAGRGKGVSEGSNCAWRRAHTGDDPCSSLLTPADSSAGGQAGDEDVASSACSTSSSAAAIYSALAVLVVLARHNLRLGRGDKKGALPARACRSRARDPYFALNRHWTFEPLDILRMLVFLMGAPLFAAGFTWLAYVGVEPFMRRRWPDLLIAWTRLLDGRWRDPMVGRSLLSGTLVALVAVGVIPGLLVVLTRTYSLPLAAPWFTGGSLDAGVWFLASTAGGWVAPVHALMLVAWLLAARLALRRDWAAWAALFFVAFGVHWWDVLFSQSWWSDASPGPPSWWPAPRGELRSRHRKVGPAGGSHLLRGLHRGYQDTAHVRRHPLVCLAHGRRGPSHRRPRVLGLPQRAWPAVGVSGRRIGRIARTR